MLRTPARIVDGREVVNEMVWRPDTADPRPEVAAHAGARYLLLHRWSFP